MEKLHFFENIFKKIIYFHYKIVFLLQKVGYDKKKLLNSLFGQKF